MCIGYLVASAWGLEAVLHLSVFAFIAVEVTIILGELVKSVWAFHFSLSLKFRGREGQECVAYVITKCHLDLRVLYHEREFKLSLQVL